MDRSSESGNVLWFLIVAIVLLGALTAILSRGGGSVDQSGDVESGRVQASAILRYAKSVETAIEHMVLQGISESDISFQNTPTGATYVNSSCDDAGDSAWPGCLVFDSRGGGIEYRSAPLGGGWIFTGANNIGSTTNPVGTTAAATGNDLVMLLPGLGSSLCTQINRDLGIGGTIPVDANGIATTPFTGSYPGGGPVIIDIDGYNAGCITDSAADITYFFYVVLAR